MKKLSFIAILFAAAALSVHAQMAVSDGWQSPQSEATQGRIRSAADDFIRPDSYVSAGVNDWFAMTSFQSTARVNLGYAKKLEKLFLGVYYGGSFWNNLAGKDYTLTTGTWLGKENSTVKGYAPPLPTPPTAAANFPNNNIAVLIGVADMGFRLSYSTTLWTFEDEEFASGATSYVSYLRQSGDMSPQLAWSMTKNIIERGIKPYATFTLTFHKDYTEEEVYMATSPTTYAGGGSQTTNSQNYLAPRVNLGLGGFTLTQIEAFRLTADLDYVFTLRSYSNEYSVLVTTGTNPVYKTHPIAGLYTGNLITGLSENSYSQHTFIPSLAGSWNGEKLRLRFKTNLNMSTTSEETIAMGVNNSSTDGSVLWKNGNTTNTSTFLFNPDLRLAAQWQIVPSFALNVGGRITVSAIESQTVETSVYVNNAETVTARSTAVTKRFGSGGAVPATGNQLTLGVTFNPTDNVTFEAASGVSNAASNDVSVFQPTDSKGLFYFYNLLLSLKF